MPALAPGLQSISDLTTTSRITTGDIPPPLVGATLTIVNDKLYLFGGRLIQSRLMTNSLYILNLIDFHWENVSEIVNIPPTRAIGDPGAEEEHEMGSPPTERYFHSANAYKNSIVIYGGMGPSATSVEGQPQDLVVFDDINILDLGLLQWRQVQIPSSPHAPKPRYAHLSSISGSKLVIIGGQDINNQYIEEICVLDLDSLQWVASMDFEKHCGSYRSIAVSGSGHSLDVPVVGSEVDFGTSSLSPTLPAVSDGLLSPTLHQHKTPSNSSLHYTPSVRRSSSNLALGKIGGRMSRLSIGPGGLSTSPPSALGDRRSSIYRLSQMVAPAQVQQEEHPVYIYSNFNFTDVKRELQVLTPPHFSSQDHSNSMSGNLLPPGLRFPTGAISGQHLLLSGTYLTNAQQSFSIWSLNLSSLVWTRIDTGTVFSTGSWNRGILMENANAYLVFGNKDRNLADDYQNRQTNFEHISIVDLEAFGIYQHPPTTMTQTAQELGLNMLNEPSMADFEILTLDQQRIPVNSAILAARWPYFETLLREQEEQEAAQCKRDSTDHDPTLLQKRTLSLPEPYPVVLAFLQYLYTDHLVTAQQHQSQVLSQLLLLADMYGLDRLRALATHALHQMLNMSTAAMVYETAALSQQTGLQIRSLKVMVAAKKMLQQQQLKLQQQQALSQSVSANHAWNSTEPIHPSYGANADPHHPSYSAPQPLQAPYIAPQPALHALFQPNPPSSLSPSSLSGPPSPDYHRLSMQTSTALPNPMVKKRTSVMGTMPPQHWNTEPLTPPPASPPPQTTAIPSPPPSSTKSSFFSFSSSKSKATTSNIPSSGASTRSGSSTGTKKVPAFASMGVAPITAESDTGSVRSGKSGKSATSNGSDADKKKAEEQRRQEVLQKLMETSFGGMGGMGMVMGGR